MTALLLIAGLISLLAGAEVLVRGASRLATATGMSPLVIGLTVVAFGTSAPELAVGIDAVHRGAPGIAIGNVVGSNITNVLLILGISALVTPLIVSRQLVWLDVPVMIASSVLVFALALDGNISRVEGGALAIAAVVYITWLIRLTRREADDADDATSIERGRWSWAIDIAMVVGGLALLVLGARWLVQSAVTVAEALGMSELVIGLTVIAVGTSMPEIATSIMAAVRGQRDIAVGNIVGSNVLNLLLVLGLTSVFSPSGIPVASAAIHFDLPVMLAAAIACLPIFFTGHCIQRWEGAVFLGYYIAYTAYLLLDAAGHDAMPAFSAVMIQFVMPLTAITLGIVLMRALRHRRQSRNG
ncbi:MAG: calcium/sodium antiporter [Pseudomonadota bacterium]|nr:calcium/sodium antiporter [Pseudomonadota bacterium]